MKPTNRRPLGLDGFLLGLGTLICLSGLVVAVVERDVPAGVVAFVLAAFFILALEDSA